MVIPEVEEQLKQLKVENVVLMGIEVSKKFNMVDQLTIIPWNRVGYEVINNQRARSASWLWSLHIQQGRME